MEKLGSVVEAQQFDIETLNIMFRITEEMEQFPHDPILAGKIVKLLFYEPSTRTTDSFWFAAAHLGAMISVTSHAKAFSSKAKGETLEDTVIVESSYRPHVIVLRYHKENGAKRAAKVSSVPIVNAGDGTGQHPTQALLDLYTIKKEFGKIEGLKIVMSGDLANGRTVHSLCYLLAKHFPKNEIIFVSPSLVRMTDNIKEYLHRNGVKWIESETFEGFLSDADVIYQTRVQAERFEDNPIALEEVRKKAKEIIINGETVAQMKESAIIMHPLPRKGEISFEVDADQRARYFQQAENGLYVRMALLKMILLGY